MPLVVVFCHISRASWCWQMFAAMAGGAAMVSGAAMAGAAAMACVVMTAKFTCVAIVVTPIL